jgi:hypothetical protein
MGLSDLAVWLLEQGREQVPDNVELMRKLAQLHERRQEWKRAIVQWEAVLKADPDDFDTQRRINDLSVKEHIARSNYRR